MIVNVGVVHVLQKLHLRDEKNFRSFEQNTILFSHQRLPFHLCPSLT
jgi:hypothetical protein